MCPEMADGEVILYLRPNPSILSLPKHWINPYLASMAMAWQDCGQPAIASLENLDFTHYAMSYSSHKPASFDTRNRDASFGVDFMPSLT